MEELSFVPSTIAISMVKKQSSLIAVMIPDIINPIYMAIVCGVEQTVRKFNYHALIVSSNNQSEEETKMLSGVTGRFVDGVIVVPACSNPVVYTAFGRPIVLVDRCLPSWDLDSVVIDNYEAAYTLCEHVIRRGHKNIGVINGLMDFNVGLERYRGIVDAMNAAGLEIPDENFINGDWYEETGYKGTQAFLSRSKRPTVIIATNNLICMGCIQALYDNKIRIGEDISLAGFDENRLADFVNPKVTVISRPTIDMGIVAAQRLMEMIQSVDSRIIKRKSVLNSKLLIGDSVKQIIR
jgi:LacI family transcriptional regulator